MKICVGETSWSDSTYLSRIYYGQDETGRKIVLKKGRFRMPRDRQEVIEFIFGLKHPNLLLPIEWKNEEGVFTEIYEHMEWPRLDRFSNQFKRNERFSLDGALAVMTQLTDVLKLFHANGIVHHDVKPTNIFVNSGSLEIKLFDYNSARRPYYLYDGVDTWNRVPPEYERGNCQIDFQFDVYQSGLIFRGLTHEYDCDKKQDIPVIVLPQSAVEIMNHATSEDRENRYKDCREFHDALKTI